MDSIKFDKENWRFKVTEGTRRMKLYIKLNKGETEGWQMIKEMASQGDSINENELAKVLFFRGVNVFIEDLKEAAETAKAQEAQEAQKEQKETSEDDSTDATTAEA